MVLAIPGNRSNGLFSFPFLNYNLFRAKPVDDFYILRIRCLPFLFFYR